MSDSRWCRVARLSRQPSRGALFSSSASVIVAILLCLLLAQSGFARVSYGSTLQQKMIQELTNEEVIAQISSRERDQATAAVEETLKRGERMIPLLMQKKGDRNYFWGGLATAKNSATLIFVPSGNSKQDEFLMKQGKFVTVEVAALYLITAIYHSGLDIAQGPYLTDYSLPDVKRRAANTKKLIKRAWKSVDRWSIELNRQGLAALRVRKHGPLDEANIGFW